MTQAAQDPVSAAWSALAALPRPSLADLFAHGDRLGLLATSLDLPGGPIRFDWSKTHLDEASLAGFERLAEVTGFAERRRALFAGEPINATEGRAVEHMAQRGLGAEASVEEAASLHARMHMLVEAIHGGAFGEVRHLIHIGIGGSALGRPWRSMPWRGTIRWWTSTWFPTSTAARWSRPLPPAIRRRR